jgi:hypothetical protein
MIEEAETADIIDYLGLVRLAEVAISVRKLEDQQVGNILEEKKIQINILVKKMI